MSTATSNDDLPSGVQKTLLGTALGLLGLLLLLDLGGLRLDLTGTCEGSVNLTHVGLRVIEDLFCGGSVEIMKSQGVR